MTGLVWLSERCREAARDPQSNTGKTALPFHNVCYAKCYLVKVGFYSEVRIPLQKKDLHPEAE